MYRKLFGNRLVRKCAAIGMVGMLLAIGLDSQAQHYTFSYTYQNVSKVNGGGTIENGDIIEVRALMYVLKASPANKTNNVYYIDTIPNGLQYIPNSMKIITNEGLLYKGPYTDATNDDLGVYTTSGGIPRLRINIGPGASNAQDGPNFGSLTGGGSIDPTTDKPKFYNGTLLVVAYQLQVTANFGDTVYLTGNYYLKTRDNNDSAVRFDYAGIKILPNDGLCTNYSSASFSAESSFGSGVLQNRAAPVDADPLYVKKDISLNEPVDYHYSIVNNTSADGDTDNSGPFKPTTNNHRVFGGFWDIIGDHTGATDPLAGNLPVPPGTNGGYMLVVNAAYATSAVYNDIIMDVCPNTYYEFSAWLRNICGTCGLDSNAKATYKPGVLPNLAFTINDIDYYNTGSLPHNNLWEKRGFIYKTGPTETSFKITIKNNAPGGGGNDWVLDDIMLATCYPNLIMSPSDTAKVCAGNLVALYDTVRSYFNNYTNYCWEKSIDGGITWSSTGVCGSKTPVLKNGMWEYVVDTAFTTIASDSGSFYRVKVATTSSNLSNPNCSVDNSQKVFMKVYNFDCSVLEGILKDFSGKLINGRPMLQWSTFNEESLKNFELQMSADGVNFTTFYTRSSLHRTGGNYSYTDSQELTGNVFYRIKLNSLHGDQSKYSAVISLYQFNNAFTLQVVNPFTSTLKMEISAPTSGIFETSLYDGSGRIVRRQSFKVAKGNNSLVMDDVAGLRPGMYILTGSMNGKVLQQKLMKSN